VGDKLLHEYTPFSSNFYLTQLPDLSHLIPFCRKLRDEDKNTVQISNRGGYQSPSFIQGDHKELDTLYELIYPFVQSIYELMDVNGTPQDGGRWVNINKKYNYNISHNHPTAYYASVVYIKVPRNSGEFVFERPDMLDDYIRFHKTTDKNTSLWHVPIEPNKLIIFPAYLKHYVEQNLTDDQDDERISIAFNFR
jgi:uncharacterized protein (TIGR02466 family)